MYVLAEQKPTEASDRQKDAGSRALNVLYSETRGKDGISPNADAKSLQEQSDLPSATGHGLLLPQQENSIPTTPMKGMKQPTSRKGRSR